MAKYNKPTTVITKPLLRSANQFHRYRIATMVGSILVFACGGVITYYVLSLTLHQPSKSPLSNDNELATFTPITPKQLDTATWTFHADPDLKVSFKYPDSVDIKNGRTMTYPSRDTTGMHAFENQISVEIEITAVARDNTIVRIDGTNIFEVMTYKPGSINDKLEAARQSDTMEGLVLDNTKHLTIDGVSGDCKYYTLTVRSYTSKSYICKFQRDNLVYHISGGSNATFGDKYPNIDTWGMSQKVLESLRFSA